MLCYVGQHTILLWEEGQESPLGRVVSSVLLFSWLWIGAGSWSLIMDMSWFENQNSQPIATKPERSFSICHGTIYLKTISLAIFLGVPSELFTQRLAGRDKRLIQRRETLGGAENLNSS